MHASECIFFRNIFFMVYRLLVGKWRWPSDILAEVKGFVLGVFCPKKLGRFCLGFCPTLICPSMGNMLGRGMCPWGKCPTSQLLCTIDVPLDGCVQFLSLKGGPSIK